MIVSLVVLVSFTNAQLCSVVHHMIQIHACIICSHDEKPKSRLSRGAGI